MKIPGAGKLQRSVRWLRGTVVPGGLILLYHRVTTVSGDPHALCVTPRHFSEHMEILRKCGRPMCLEQLARELQNGRPLRRALVVTFDDGYADNLHQAKPMLERYDVPATVFVTAGYVGHAREFWWDRLERLVLHSDRLSGTLGGRVNGQLWESRTAARLVEGVPPTRQPWALVAGGDVSQRQRLHRVLWRLLRPVPNGEREMRLADLVPGTAGRLEPRETHRPLSTEELVRLGEGRLVEIGAHTMTHPVLSALPTTAQRTEIERSKIILEEILGRPVTSFSYPYGDRPDYTEDTVSIVRGAGFVCACSAIASAVRPNISVFELPRVLVQDWDGEAFARRVREWFGA